MPQLRRNISKGRIKTRICDPRLLEISARGSGKESLLAQVPGVLSELKEQNHLFRGGRVSHNGERNQRHPYHLVSAMLSP